MLKILQVHNRYQHTGGEDRVVFMEREILESHGNRVILYSADNDEIYGILPRIRAAMGVHYSRRAKRQFALTLAAVRPDIVHVHNFFPLITPSIFDACKEASVPVVQTLHNYRLICPGALLVRKGAVCELCLQGNAYKSAVYGCYRGSRIGSLLVAHMVEYHRKRRTWNTKVDRFIILTDFARSRFVEAGFPADKIVVKPNFVQAPVVFPQPSIRSGALFVGRLSNEKGISTLLKAWQAIDLPLRIAGDGPLLAEAMRMKPSNVTFLGRITATDVMREMNQAMFLVVPSECYENFPLVIPEAFACGLPIVISRLGSMEEIVEDHGTGLHFTAGNASDLAEKVAWAASHKEILGHMGENARKTYESRYSAEANYQQLMTIYTEVASK
jgi:glycosyltransferase involved in cell wall biosynthesis